MREDLVARCRAGMDIERRVRGILGSLQARRKICFFLVDLIGDRPPKDKRQAPQAVAGKAGTAATEDGGSTSASDVEAKEVVR